MGRDVNAKVQYLGPRVGITISWYVADAGIIVSFAEVLESGVFPAKQASFGHYPDRAKAINLEVLAEMLDHGDDPDFLLGKLSGSRRRNKRAKLIETNMHDILAGLARATQTYAIDILKGDTSIFPEVMNYYTEKQIKLYGDHPQYH